MGLGSMPTMIRVFARTSASKDSDKRKLSDGSRPTADCSDTRENRIDPYASGFQAAANRLVAPLVLDPNIAPATLWSGQLAQLLSQASVHSLHDGL